MSIPLKGLFLREVGSDFTTEFLRNDVGCQFGLKDLKGGPVVEVERFDRSPGDDPDEKLVRCLTRNGVDREVKTVEAFVFEVF